MAEPDHPTSSSDAKRSVSEAKLRRQLAAAMKKIRHLNEVLHESEASTVRLSDQAKLLKEEIRRLERNQEREQAVTNMEYLKNVVLKVCVWGGGKEKGKVATHFTCTHTHTHTHKCTYICLHSSSTARTPLSRLVWCRSSHSCFASVLKKYNFYRILSKVMLKTTPPVGGASNSTCDSHVTTITFAGNPSALPDAGSTLPSPSAVKGLAGYIHRWTGY